MTRTKALISALLVGASLTAGLAFGQSLTTVATGMAGTTQSMAVSAVSSLINASNNAVTWKDATTITNTGSGVGRVQIDEGYSANLNITAATTVKATTGRVFKLNVIVAGATGQVCDNNGACAAANVVFQIPAAVGTYDLNWPMATGIRVEPGAAQVVAISWQ